jgi:hypothetical protein
VICSCCSKSSYLLRGEDTSITSSYCLPPTASTASVAVEADIASSAFVYVPVPVNSSVLVLVPVLSQVGFVPEGPGSIGSSFSFGSEVALT